LEGGSHRGAAYHESGKIRAFCGEGLKICNGVWAR
jgi:hypothetical protein